MNGLKRNIKISYLVIMMILITSCSLLNNAQACKCAKAPVNSSYSVLTDNYDDVIKGEVVEIIPVTYNEELKELLKIYKKDNKDSVDSDGTIKQSINDFYNSEYDFSYLTKDIKFPRFHLRHYKDLTIEKKTSESEVDIEEIDIINKNPEDNNNNNDVITNDSEISISNPIIRLDIKLRVTGICKSSNFNKEDEFIYFSTNSETAACGFYFETGREYVVFASDKKVNSCSPTIDISKDNDNDKSNKYFYKALDTCFA